MDEIKRTYQSLRAHLIGALRIFAALFLNLAQHLELTSQGLFADV